MPRQFTLFLSTQTPTTQFRTYAPTAVLKTTNSNSATWFINWDTLFGQYRTGKMKVRYQFQSGTSGSVPTWNTGNGTIRVLKGLSTNTQAVYNGVILGLFQFYTGILPSTDGYLYGDTTSSNGVECNIPKGYSELQIALVSPTEVQTSLTLDWGIILFFEVDDDKKSNELLGEV